MSIIVGTFPTNLQNGTPEDATQVMTLFAWIQSQVNGNACAATTSSSVLKGDGVGNTTPAIAGQDYVTTTSDYGVASGTVSAFAVTVGGAIAALFDGLRVRIKAPAANTGPVTLNVNSLGAQPIYQFSGYPLVGGEIIVNSNVDLTWNSSYNSGNGAWVLENTSAQVPVGSVTRWDSATAPAGWLLRNGQAVPRTVYAALFALYGTTYGVGDGSTTFNLPNTVDRMPITAGNLYAQGANGGAKDAIVVAHTHEITDGGHAHPYGTAPSKGLSSGGDPNGVWGGGSGGNNATSGTATTAISINSTGSSGTNANLPPYFANYEIVKA